MNLGLQNKVILVTGGAKGIGRGIAEVLAGEGTIPVLLDRDADAGDETVRTIVAAGGQAYAIAAELTRSEECRRAVAETVARWGRIEGLVNNAGVNDGVSLEDGDSERFLASLRKNLFHYYEIAHFALPYLKATRGAIVNISSKVAETGQGHTSAYAAANGGRNALTREWAVELAPYGIRVNAVIVAECWTPMYADWIRPLADPEAERRRIEARIPFQKRMTTCEEIGNMTAFLLSPRSSHTTGTTCACRWRLRSLGSRPDVKRAFERIPTGNTYRGLAMSILSRRDALKTIAGTAAVVAGSTSFATAADERAAALSVVVRLKETIGTIKPAIYSQFAEHIGGVIYDGIWVGPKSKVANVDGIRRTLIEHVRRLGRVVVRWPGGCFADKYHWRDGIGPRDQRPRRFGRWKETTESNQFGTHEFLHFCRLCNVEPYLAANVGTGTAEEFQQWVEYCNAPAGSTTLADERAANGDEKPFGVRYWGVGNESWGCGGKFTPEDYCREYRKFTDWLPGYRVPLYLIAAGPDGNNAEWTRRFFKKWADFARAPLHGWAPHYYCGTTGHALKFSVDQWYEQLAKANRMEKLLVEQWAILGEFDREHKIKLIVDEWGCWHPAGTEINREHLFEQMGCLRDALVAALTLDTFNRHADKVDMANIAQLVNNLHSLFLADGNRFVTTPTFHIFEMYKPHHGAQAVKIDVEAPEVAFTAEGKEQKLFRLAGSASVRDKQLTLTLVHTAAREPAEIVLRLRDGKAEAVRQTVLTHEKLNAHNTFDNPDTVKPTAREVKPRGEDISCVLPPASVVRFDVKLA